MSTITLNSQELLEHNLTPLLRDTRANPFNLVTKVGEKIIAKLIGGVIPYHTIGRLITNEATNETWLEIGMWRHAEQLEKNSKYLHCDGVWRDSTISEDYDKTLAENQIEYLDKSPVTSDKDRTYTGWYNSHVELIFAYLLYLRKEHKISSISYFLATNVIKLKSSYVTLNNTLPTPTLKQRREKRIEVKSKEERETYGKINKLIRKITPDMYINVKKLEDKLVEHGIVYIDAADLSLKEDKDILLTLREFRFKDNKFVDMFTDYVSFVTEVTTVESSNTIRRVVPSCSYVENVIKPFLYKYDIIIDCEEEHGLWFKLKATIK